MNEEEVRGIRRSLESHGLTILGILEWRTAERDAGRPFELVDFFIQHGLCFTCQSSGLVLKSRDVYDLCPFCLGSGLLSPNECDGGPGEQGGGMG